MTFNKFEGLTLVVLSSLICVSFGFGLPGDFAFDDGVNLLYNANFVFVDFDLGNILRATFSSESGPFGRPVAMFSFALNQFFAGGIYPFGLKLTNIIIHVVNSLLLYLLLKVFFTLPVAGAFSQRQKEYVPIVLPFIWGLHPFVLTSVLYVIQRMTSLSVTFMFISLINYLLLRKIELSGGRIRLKQWVLLFLGAFSFILAILTKETALLLGFFVLVFEISFFRFKSDNGLSRLALSVVVIFVFIPVLLLSIKTLYDPSWIINGYSGRPFSLTERVLTQPRVILFYLSQIYFPNISEMGVFHDDLQISSGWDFPKSTPFAFVACLTLFSLAIGSCFTRNPVLKVFGFSFTWFFVGHLLESTVFPLEIAHEHRNYLPMIGPLFFGIYLFLYVESKRFLFLQTVALISIIALCISLTSLRALSWQNLTDHALSEVLNHPASSRSQYQLGRVYLKWYQETSDISYLDLARKAFAEAIKHDWEGRNAAYFGIINLAFLAGETPDQQIVDQLKQRLKLSKSLGADMVFLSNLAQCQIAQECRLTDEDFLILADAFLENKNIGSGVRSSVLAIVGAYYVNKLDERLLAERFFLDAIDASPTVLRYLDLAEYYRITARFSRSKELLAEAEKISKASDRVNLDRFRLRLSVSEMEYGADYKN